MNLILMLISVVAMVASAPTETKDTVINVEGPDGRHVQTGEPGKAVAGYFTSQGENGVEHKTTYEADEQGFRAKGSHLPVSPTDSSARLPTTLPVLYPTSAFPIYGFRYGPQNYLPFAYPTYPQDKYLAGGDHLSYDNIAFKQGGNQLPLSGQEILALAQDAQIPLTAEEIAALTGRGVMTTMMMPLTLTNKLNLLMMILIKKMLLTMG
ncbi:uncharacterized protein LOC116934235 isoform X2 [Daphnia magna]|uniref:uncharacterized protein LOC116934235 isoform X1 n=1 Tax=Daphnia magna TaxID=35525 RepID=UPI001E1BDDCE|nr:uncharacterized protein LOC116934235 isoform X1 [Daphnia magna]XP_045033377.1 uncharacterized protein LOC116934235 isoform X2 [Daphnia magna]